MLRHVMREGQSAEGAPQADMGKFHVTKAPGYPRNDSLRRLLLWQYLLIWEKSEASPECPARWTLRSTSFPDVISLRIPWVILHKEAPMNCLHSIILTDVSVGTVKEILLMVEFIFQQGLS